MKPKGPSRRAAARPSKAQGIAAKRSSEERFRALVENNPDAVGLQRVDGSYFYVSPSAERILGYSIAELAGKPSSDLVHPDDSERVAESLERCLRQPGQPVTLEYRLRHRDGTWRDVQVVRVNRLAEPHVRAVVVNLRDITERKRAEQALVESEARFRSLIESSWEAIALFDAEGHILYTSPSTHRVLGYEPASILGHHVLEFVHPDDRAIVSAKFAEALARPARGVDLRARVRRAEGAWRTTEGTLTNLLQAPGVGAVVNNYRDVTGREESAEALRHSERLLRGVFEGAMDAMLIADDEGRYLEANPAACELLGRGRGDILGHTVADVAAPGQDLSAAWKEFLRTGNGRGEFRIAKPNGEVRDVEFAASVNILPGRHFTALRDLTGRKRMEEQLLQSQKMEAVGRLAAGVAHDFNNLLSVIGGYSELVMRRLQDQDPLRSKMGEVLKATDRAAALTRQLLAFGRKEVVQPRVLVLDDVVAGMEGMLRRLIGENVELVARLGRDPGRVKADAGQIEQVVMNLAINARDAMPGGGKLTLTTESVEMSEDDCRRHVGLTAGPYVRLAVEDSGLGMDAATEARVFEPFFSTKSRDKGTGLGLSTVYGIVKQSGGLVFVESELGRGSTFKVYLPRVADDVEAVAGPRADEGSPRGTETILLVEDEEAVRVLTQESLEECGYFVLSARGGDQALALAQGHQGPIHLMMTDVVMPGMSGPVLAQRLISVRSALRVLYSSGYPEDAIADHGVLDPGIQFIQKPFTLAALARKVREVLETP